MLSYLGVGGRVLASINGTLLSGSLRNTYYLLSLALLTSYLGRLASGLLGFGYLFMWGRCCSFHGLGCPPLYLKDFPASNKGYNVVILRSKETNWP